MATPVNVNTHSGTDHMYTVPWKKKMKKKKRKRKNTSFPASSFSPWRERPLVYTVAVSIAQHPFENDVDEEEEENGKQWRMKDPWDGSPRQRIVLLWTTNGVSYVVVC